MSEQESEKIYDQPPFPPLRDGADYLKGVDFFASWRGFCAGEEICDGNIRVFMEVVESPDPKPSTAQTNAYQFLKENEAQVAAVILAGLLADYPQIRAAYDGVEEEYLPAIENAKDFRRAIKPIHIHINQDADDECAYIGFEFDCSWDIEHGLGVMTHRLRYIGCNVAEAAWNLDLAQS